MNEVNMSMKNSILRRCNRAVVEHLGNIKLRDEADAPSLSIIEGDAKEAKEWGFTISDGFLFGQNKEDFQLFCLTQRFPVLAVRVAEDDFSGKDAILTYEVSLVAVHQHEIDYLSQKVDAKLKEKKGYKLSADVSGVDLEIKTVKARQWRFTVEFAGLGGSYNGLLPVEKLEEQLTT
jgi:hypothetical protein